jgi:hypothetical protein
MPHRLPKSWRTRFGSGQGVIACALALIVVGCPAHAVCAQTVTAPEGGTEPPHNNRFAVIANGTPEEGVIYESERSLAEQRTKQGQKYLKDKELDQATKMFQQVMSDWRFANMVPYREYANALIKNGHDREALALYRFLTNPGSLRHFDAGVMSEPDQSMQFVLLLYKARCYDEAYHVFLNARQLIQHEFVDGINGVPVDVEIDDDNYDTKTIQVAAHLAIAAWANGSGSEDEAASNAEAAIRLRPNLAVAHFYLAEILRHHTKPSAANRRRAQEEYQIASKQGHGLVWAKAEEALGHTHSVPASKPTPSNHGSATTSPP